MHSKVILLQYADNRQLVELVGRKPDDQKNIHCVNVYRYSIYIKCREYTEYTDTFKSKGSRNPSKSILFPSSLFNQLQSGLITIAFSVACSNDATPPSLWFPSFPTNLCKAPVLDLT